MIKNKSTEKQLSTQLKQLEGEMEAMKVQISNFQKEYEQKRKTAKELKEKINRLANPTEPKISEHAMLRYFERVKGYDLAAIRAEILSPEVLQLVSVLGPSGVYPNRDYSVRMKDNVVVTILGNAQ